MPVAVFVALAVGVPSVQPKAIGLLETWVKPTPPIGATLLICDVTPALWSKLLAVVRPQCAQSAVPSPVRFTGLVGVVNVPDSVPLEDDACVVAVAVLEYVLRLPAASVARTR